MPEIYASANIARDVLCCAQTNPGIDVNAGNAALAYKIIVGQVTPH
jgi:hypothetical protein